MFASMLRGPVSIAADVTAKEGGNLLFDIATGGDATDVASDITGIVQLILSKVVFYAVGKHEKLVIDTTDWVTMPNIIPELHIPYIVKECSDEWLECCHHATKYNVVLYNTHTGHFICLPAPTKDDMMREFNSRLQDIKKTLAGHPDGFRAIKEGTDPGYIMQNYMRTPAGTERLGKLVNVSDTGMIHFPRARKMSFDGFVSQSLIDRRGRFLDNKTGSWKAMFKQLRIKYKAGTEPQSIISSISNFIGLWGCAAGTVSNIHLASDGVISNDARFIGNAVGYISCCLCSSKPPNSSYKVGSKYDLIGAWC